MWLDISHWAPPVFVLGGIALAYAGAFWSRKRLRKASDPVRFKRIKVLKEIKVLASLLRTTTGGY